MCKLRREGERPDGGWKYAWEMETHMQKIFLSVECMKLVNIVKRMGWWYNIFNKIQLHMYSVQIWKAAFLFVFLTQLSNKYTIHAFLHHIKTMNQIVESCWQKKNHGKSRNSAWQEKNNSNQYKWNNLIYVITVWILYEFNEIFNTSIILAVMLNVF